MPNQILEILTKHFDLLKPLNPDTEETRLLARLVEDRRKAVDLRTSHIQALTRYSQRVFSSSHRAGQWESDLPPGRRLSDEVAHF